MLEINNIDKYFNRHKKNELHVINNTTLKFADSGLVALLGPSGCGKTTLLNTIGGLDKVKKGSIYVDGNKISSRFTGYVDKLRNFSIGYIFQDYKLIDNLSVYENVAIVLKMLGIKDKKEIKKRVEYILDSLGMLRYKKRPASMLSGGQKQRVAIARALVKNPKIILADEPTGNLDSKNSIEIMNIITAISKEKLVILVTHEENLAKFYANRIIELKDGQVIADYPNIHNDELDYQIDNRFYLKDFQNKTNITKDNYNITIYDNNKTPIDLKIVIKNGNLYLKNDTLENLEVVDDNNNIEFINDHYKTIAKQDLDKYKFDLPKINSNRNNQKLSSIYPYLTSLTQGFKKVFSYNILKKILLIGFFLSGMFIMYSLASVKAQTTINDEDFVKINQNYLTITTNKIKLEDYLDYEKQTSINYLLPGDSLVNFNVKYDDYYQTSTVTDNLEASLSSINLLEKKDLIYGRLPSNKNEVVVDKMSIINMFNQSDYAKMSGITKVKDMLFRKITQNNFNDFIIVGISDKKSPSIYTDNSQFVNIIANSTEKDDSSNSNYTKDQIVDYDLYKDKIELKKGNYPINDYETIVNITDQESMPLNKEISIKVGTKKLKVVGYYQSKYDYNYYLTNNNTIKYKNITTKNNISLIPNNSKTALKYFHDLKLNINQSYEQSRNKYLESKKENIKNTLLVSGIMLAISLIEIFLMIRASFLSRIKEIGIYRAIGIKKLDIYKMFAGEIIAITTIASVPGLLLMSYILKILSNVKELKSYFLITNDLILIAIIFVYLFNLLIGLLPIFTTIKNPPAKILSRYDLD